MGMPLLSAAAAAVPVVNETREGAASAAPAANRRGDMRRWLALVEQRLREIELEMREGAAQTAASEDHGAASAGNGAASTQQGDVRQPLSLEEAAKCGVGDARGELLLRLPRQIKMVMNGSSWSGGTGRHERQSGVRERG